MLPGFVRIIGGKWRGRRLKVPHMAGLRPTPDRVRETLFNWLAPVIEGSRCLDLFAGSGALGFEALSRGAGYVAMIDQSPQVVQLLQQELARFQATNADIYQATMPNPLPGVVKPFDIVFVDPPYQDNLLFPCCEYLEEHGFLHKVAYVYLEAAQPIEDNELPLHWQIIKKKRAGQVYYHLVRREE